MINYTLTHPGLLAALAESGHGSQILVADGNYPHNTGAPAAATRIALNLRPGLLTIDQILEVLIDAVPIEAAAVMTPPDGNWTDAVKGYEKPWARTSPSPLTSVSISTTPRGRPTSRSLLPAETPGITPTSC